jgi:hypothetical protein
VEGELGWVEGGAGKDRKAGEREESVSDRKGGGREEGGEGERGIEFQILFATLLCEEYQSAVGEMRHLDSTMAGQALNSGTGVCWLCL